VSVSGLLALLEAVGARLTLDGDGLALTGKRPPVALLDAVKERRAEVLAHLRDMAPAKEEAAGGGEVVSNCDDLPPPWEDLAPDASSSPVNTSVQGASIPARPDWPTLSASPGHCGSCARFELAPEWGAHMGTCGCPASGWPDNSRPLAIHEGHRCAAYRGDGEEVGRGYRARASGKRYSLAPLEPVPLEDPRRAAVAP
jgi:hypothetical protein